MNSGCISTASGGSLPSDTASEVSYDIAVSLRMVSTLQLCLESKQIPGESHTAKAGQSGLGRARSGQR